MKSRWNDIVFTSKRISIPIADIQCQYIPVLFPLELWNYDLRLKNSPHVELLRIISGYGFDWDKIMKSRYVQERRRRFIMGMERWTDDYIKEHVQRRWKIYKSLGKYGYRKKIEKDKPVVVLDKPFWRTRFGLKKKFLKGKECWDGFGRLSAAYLVGLKEYPIVMAKDRYPGSGKKGKFESKLKDVEGLWDTH